MASERMCVVCDRIGAHTFLCPPCKRSLDRVRNRDATLLAVIQWAVARTKHAMRKARKRP